MKLVFRIVACFAALILLAFLLAGCNMSLTPGNYNFKVVHICDGVKCCDVEISRLLNEDDDRELVCSTVTVDKRLRQIVGEEHFAP